MSDFEGELIRDGEFLSSRVTEEELAEQVHNLYEEIRVPLHGYLRRTLSYRGEAEDVVQEVFLRLLRALLAGERIPFARAWIYRAAHNLAIDWERGRHETVGVEALQFRTGPADAEAAVITQERDKRLSVALAVLTDQEKQCLELRCEGLRYAQIGEILGLQLSTVATYIARAVKKISRQLQ
jgi:RNA polymerase sigma-70 factor, ECF subfamily